METEYQIAFYKGTTWLHWEDGSYAFNRVNCVDHLKSLIEEFGIDSTISLCELFKSSGV